MKRSTLVAAIAVVAVSTATLAASGCASTDTGSGAPTAATAPAGTTAGGAAAGLAGPVTIDHRYGATTVEARPERIVSIDTQWTDVLVALDAPLIGAAVDPMARDGRYRWQDIPSTVADIEVGDAIPFEAIVDLDPDLIVVSWAAAGEADYERLSQIAPTIPLLGDEEVDSWQDMAEVAGRVLGDPTSAQALIDGSDAMVADLAADLPGLDGKTYALANYVPGDAIYVVADPDDGAARFFAQMGMAIDPDLVALADGASGRAKLSLERIDELDADLLILLTNGADPADIPGYATLPAVSSGAVAILDVDTVTGLNTPTPLSLAYAIDAVRPALEAAAGAS